MRLLRSKNAVILLFVAVLMPHVFAQRPDYKLLRWQENKFFWLSSDAPMTKALDDIPDVVSGVKLLLEHFERVENKLISEVGKRTVRSSDKSIRECRSPDQKWAKAVSSNFGVRGFPDPDVSCVTDFSGVRFSPDEAPPYTLDELYNAVLRRGLAIQTNAKSIASRFVDVDTNYTEPTVVFNFPYDTATASCVLHPVNGMRVGGKWRLSTGIQNRPMHEALPNFGRFNIVEFNRVVDGHLTDNMLMRLPVRPKSGTERVIREDATTLIINSRGNSNPSMFRDIRVEANPATLEALDIASIFIQQAEDASTPSNIAILLLPLALNIIPVALVAQVGSIQMLLYIILSDILTVIPLLIKGIELILIEQGRHRAVVLRLSSSLNSSRAEAAAAEMWAAECRAKENVRTVGIVFVSLSVVFLVGGTVLELVARRYAQNRFKRRQESEVSESSSTFDEMGEFPGQSEKARDDDEGSWKDDDDSSFSPYGAKSDSSGRFRKVKEFISRVV